MSKKYEKLLPENLPLMNAEQFRLRLESSYKNFYVYGLCDEKGRLFYVGKGAKYENRTIGIRALVHESDARSNWCNSGPAKHIRKVWNRGGQVQYCCFHNCSHEWHSLLFEQATISRYGLKHDGGLLINKNLGGASGGTGYKLTKLQKLKLSASSSLKKLTQSHKDAISLGLKNSNKQRLGVHSTKALAYRATIEKPVIIEGVWYKSVREAWRNSSLSMGGIIKRLKSDSFLNYKYANKGAA